MEVVYSFTDTYLDIQFLPSSQNPELRQTGACKSDPVSP